MDTATHYQNASFLRELAESLAGTNKPEQVALLQGLADQELAEAEHIEWVRAKVAAARADTRPTLTTAEVRSRLQARYERFRDAL
jgi:hypothetical protein